MPHENTHTKIEEYIKNNPDLQMAIDLLKREHRVTRVMLQVEFGWTEWKARKVYEQLRYICYKGLSFKISENRSWICRVEHGGVRLLLLNRELEDMVIDEEFSQERMEEEEFEEEESEEESLESKDTEEEEEEEVIEEAEEEE